MILLDTNVLSESLRLAPDPRVVAWLDSLDEGAAGIPAVVMAELYFGIESMPEGRRRDTLRAALDRLVSEGYHSQIVPFDMRAAHCYGQLMATRRQAGRRMDIVDAQVAAIALANGAQLATRDGDFAGCGIEIINPWAQS